MCARGFETNVQAKVYKLDKTYTFKGILKKVKFEHPNGTKLTANYIKLKKKIKVRYYGQDNKSRIVKVNKIQLIPAYPISNQKKQYKKYNKKLGKKIKARGDFHMMETAYYYCTFNLFDTVIKE